MRLTPLQASFAAGEISPELYGRVDSPIYQRGLKQLVNMYTTAHGSAVRRGGFKYRSVFLNTTNGLLIPFPDGNSRNTVLALLDNGNVYLFQQSYPQPPSPPPNAPPGPAIGTAYANNVPDPYNQLFQNELFEDGQLNWDMQIINPADASANPDIYCRWYADRVEMKTIQVDRSSWARPRITQEVAVPDPNGRYWMRLKTVLSDTTDVDPTVLFVTIGSQPPPAPEIPTGYTGEEPWLTWYRNYNIEQFELQNDGSAAEHQFEFSAEGHDRIWVSIGLYPRVAYAGDLTSPNEFGIGYAAIDEVELRELITIGDPADSAPVVSGDPHQPINPSWGVVNPIGSHQYNNDQLQWVQYCYTPDKFGVILTHVNHLPRQFDYDPIVGTYNWGAMSFNTSPSEWGANNYPRCAAYHGNRLYFAGSLKEPWRIWASKVGAFSYCGVPTTPADDDAMQFDLNDRQDIHWLVSHRDLLVGTNKAEFILTSQSGAILYSDHQLVQQGATGSHALMPIKVDDKLIFVSPDGHRLYSYGFSDTVDGWRVDELTINARHLFFKDRIRQIVLDQHPHRIIWVRTAAGRLLSMTYEETAEGMVAAWARHTIHGNLRSLATAVGIGTSTLYVLTYRKLGLYGWALCYESLSEEEYLDSYVVRSSTTPTTTFSGPSHLANTWVSVLTRQYNDPYGELHRDVLVDNVGTIEIDYPAREIVVGIKSSAYLTTLPLDLGGRESSMGPAKKRYSQIFARIINSHKPKINGKMPPERLPTDGMDRMVRPRTENCQVTNFGHNDSARVRIMQDKPYGLYVAGIYGKLTFDSP